MTANELRDLALSFPGTEEKPHFERAAFKVTGKRIFASLDERTSTANLKLLPEEQAVFCSFDKKSVYPLPNNYGLQGWTTFELKNIPAELMLDALNAAYRHALMTKGKKK